MYTREHQQALLDTAVDCLERVKELASKTSDFAVDESFDQIYEQLRELASNHKITG